MHYRQRTCIYTISNILGICAEAKANAAVGGQWIQKRVPLEVVPVSGSSEAHSRTLIDLCQVLFDEERHAFQQAREKAADV